VALGKVACYALACILDRSDFTFTGGTRLSDVRGRRFEGGVDGTSVSLYPTGLPVRRRSGRSRTTGSATW
jgi:hypothetical protein